jgi:benzoyl-CoA reductase subunit D
MITAGIDMGSRSVKVVLLEELKVDGAPALKYGVKKVHIMMPGDLDQDVAADKAYDEALAAAGHKGAASAPTAGTDAKREAAR